jgi:hypothetical protein
MMLKSRIIQFEKLRCASIRKHWGIIYLSKFGIVYAEVFNNQYIGRSLYKIARFKCYHTAKRWIEHNQSKIYKWANNGIGYDRISDTEFDLITGK